VNLPVILWGSISGLAYSSVLLVDGCNFFVHYDVCGEISSCSASPTFTSLCPRDGKGRHPGPITIATSTFTADCH
jgi:hypothetical protein